MAGKQGAAWRAERDARKSKFIDRRARANALDFGVGVRRASDVRSLPAADQAGTEVRQERPQPLAAVTPVLRLLERRDLINAIVFVVSNLERHFLAREDAFRRGPDDLPHSKRQNVSGSMEYGAASLRASALTVHEFENLVFVAIAGFGDDREPKLGEKHCSGRASSE